MITVTTRVRLDRSARGKRTIRLCAPSEAQARVPIRPRVPRISKLVALALKFDRLLREGVVADVSELARLASITQPRATQLLNLSLLAPDIIEDLLFLTSAERGRDRVHERALRPVVAEANWSAQRTKYRALTRNSA